MSSNRHHEYKITEFYSTYVYIHDDDGNKVCFHYSILKDLINELKEAEQICIENWKKTNETKEK